VVDDYIQHHHHAPVVGGIHEIPQVLAGAETGIDVEEILDGVAVVGVQIHPLLEGRIDPQAGDAQAFEVVELGEDAPQGAAGERQPRFIQAALSLARNRSGWSRSNRGRSCLGYLFDRIRAK
jgi:hypothetical protein